MIVSGSLRGLPRGVVPIVSRSGVLDPLAPCQEPAKAVSGYEYRRISCRLYNSFFANQPISSNFVLLRGLHAHSKGSLASSNPGCDGVIRIGSESKRHAEDRVHARSRFKVARPERRSLRGFLSVRLRGVAEDESHSSGSDQLGSGFEAAGKEPAHPASDPGRGGSA